MEFQLKHKLILGVLAILYGSCCYLSYENANAIFVGILAVFGGIYYQLFAAESKDNKLSTPPKKDRKKNESKSTGKTEIQYAKTRGIDRNNLDPIKKKLFSNADEESKKSRVGMLKHAYGKGMKSQSTTNIAADKQHLYVEVTEDDDLYKAMLKCEKDAPVTGKKGPDGKKEPKSVRMPMWKPFVCVSFPGKGLRERNFKRGRADSALTNIETDKAGREPWAVCDYIRDALYWPTDFMFIDGEQVGSYNVDHYDEKEKKHFLCGSKLMKTRDESNGYRIWQKSRKRGDGYRNWKRVFTWAQGESKLNLFFISSVWLQSPYCLGELADLIKLKYKNSSKDKLNKHGLFFVVLDNDMVDYKKIGVTLINVLKDSVGSENYDMYFKKYETQPFTAKEFCKTATKVIVKLCEGAKIDSKLYFNYQPGKDPSYNLSKFGEFFNEEIKPSEQFKEDLKDACKECVKLKDGIKAFIEKCVFNGKSPAEGDLDVQRMERSICKDIKEVGDWDPKNERVPIRNRYALHEADRRFQINNLTKAEIFPAAFKKGILPLVSDRKWKSISEYIKRRGSIRNAEELRAIKGIGKDTVDIIAPLITFATDK